MILDKNKGQNIISSQHLKTQFHFIFRSVYFSTTLFACSSNWTATSPLAVMATTFSNRMDKLDVYINTIRNWAEFLPTIQPVLFTTFESGPVIEIAKKYGWHVYPAPEVNRYGFPVFKSMYLFEYKQYKGAYLFGTASGDMLFDDGLPETIKLMYKHKGTLGRGLMFGIRFNYNMSSGCTTEPLWQIPTVYKLAHNSTLTQLFRPDYLDASDYHFVTAKYPFYRIKPVVMCRQGFDTYFIARTNTMGLLTLHATHSIGAVHQTDKDGNMAGIESTAHKPDQLYNRWLVGKFFEYGPGYARNAKYHAVRDPSGAITFNCTHCHTPKILV